ncbi:DUF1120 domain-containing protein [Pseudomonas costantinii]|uniref:DUF1120 domain-containing protein n=1 Tax=Pseudomonas costantinii TaxID=168469 RepID=A0A1S2UT54_9PSED|nr:DUF1120 domain-containing protein [Pseudomonas costantinii]NVZ22929.1 DUF1120 domain-containing protein [Pseudomonas costantinii]OIN49632.1 hypothetical protein BFL40_23085 [Pseudomonas costantinii]SEE22331.1 Protein of unknown function [Pseudomonas costantinii]
MNKHIPASMALLLAACAPGAFAASSTDLSVTGVITPSSCTPSLSGGGIVDHGKLAGKDLDVLLPTPLQVAEMALEVHCEGRTLFTLTTVDNRAGSSAINPDHHGLGMVNEDQKLGSVALAVLEPMADNTAVQTITSRDGGTTWAPSSYLGHAALTSFAATAAPQTPVALQDLTARLHASTVIAPAGDLSLQDELPIDGHVTLQLKYW